MTVFMHTICTFWWHISDTLVFYILETCQWSDFCTLKLAGKASFYNRTSVYVIGITNFFSTPFTRHGWRTSSQLFCYPLYEFSTADTALADLHVQNPTIDKSHINYIAKYMHRPTPNCCFYRVKKPCHLVEKVNSHFCFIVVQY